MIFTDPIESRAPGLTLEDYSTSLQGFLGATAEDAFIKGPLSSLVRFSRDQEAETGIPLSLPLVGFLTPPSFKLSRLLDTKEANERGKTLGLKFEAPVREKRLKMLMDRKTAEVARQSVFRQADNQRTYGLGFATALLASAVDPIQLGVSFVPVVGPARWAALAARVGRLPARAAVGLAEGFVGSVAVEPIVFAQAQFEQADYGLYESLINVTFGTVLGGGLHVAFGGVGEALGRAGARAASRLEKVSAAIDRQQGRVPMSERLDMVAPQTREAALRMTLSELQAGRSARIADDILGLDPSYRATEVSPTALNAGRAAKFDEIEGLPQASHSMAQREYVAINARGAKIGVRHSELLQRLDEKANDLQALELEDVKKQGDLVNLLEDREVTAKSLVKGFEVGPLGRRKKITKTRRAVLKTKLRKLDKKISIATKPADSKIARLNAEISSLKRKVAKLEKDGVADFPKEHKASVEAALDAGQAVPQRVLATYPELHQRANAAKLIEPEPDFNMSQTARAFQENLDNPEKIDIADFEAARLARDDVRLKEAEANPERAAALATEAEQELADIAAGLGLDKKEVAALLKEADDGIAKAKAHAKAVKAAANCQVRKASAA